MKVCDPKTAPFERAGVIQRHSELEKRRFVERKRAAPPDGGPKRVPDVVPVQHIANGVVPLQRNDVRNDVIGLVDLGNGGLQIRGQCVGAERLPSSQHIALFPLNPQSSAKKVRSPQFWNKPRLYFIPQ